MKRTNDLSTEQVVAWRDTGDCECEVSTVVLKRQRQIRSSDTRTWTILHLCVTYVEDFRRPVFRAIRWETHFCDLEPRCGGADSSRSVRYFRQVDLPILSLAE